MIDKNLKRREFLNLLFTYFFTSACRSKNYRPPLVPFFSGQKIVIIGAGIAGLQSAKSLLNSGFNNLLILEAKHRWGGRIYTNYEFADFPLELGAEELHGENTVFKAMADRHRAVYADSKGGIDYYFYQGKLLGESTMEENVLFDGAMQLVENWTDYGFTDKPVDKVLESFPFSNDPYILAFLNARLGNENGTDNSKLSAGLYAKYSSRNSSGDSDFLLKTGISELLKLEYKEVFPFIQYNQVVSKIDSTGLKIKVHTVEGRVEEADRVIVTVPLGVLKENKIQFQPDLPIKKQEAIVKLGFDAGMKVILKFKKRFWPQSMGSLFGKGIVPEFWATGNGRGSNLFLTAFVMGSSARSLSSLPKTGIEKEVLHQLDSIFGGQASQNFERGIVMDWLKEEYTKGGYSSTVVGCDEGFENLAEPIQNRIYFAGEATRSDGTHQTVHGAMLSGIDACKKIIQNIISFFIIFFIYTFFTSKIISKEKLEIEKESTNENLKPNISVFVDTYYAHSSLQYPERKRLYGTQIMNDKEFSLNHALLNLENKNKFFRYALGVHTGTYVQTNYANEPKELQYVYQAFAGIPILDNLWLDVGIFPSHIGGESAISINNFNYTRSLIADNSPYYESGARLQYKPVEKLLIGFYMLNGWQKIKDDNKDKAGGLELVYKWNDSWSLHYSFFGGNEAPDFEPRQTRYFQDIHLRGKIIDKLEIFLAYDLGFQKKKSMSWTEILNKPEIWTSTTPQDSFYRWQGFTLQIYYHLAEKWKLGIRGEGYLDKNEVIVQTGSPDGYQVYSGSLNLDYIPFSRAMIRLEAKHISSINPIFRQESNEASNTDNVLIGNFSFKM